MPLTRIQSLGITDGTIVNADINASAAIAGTKLSAGAVLQVVSTNKTDTFTTTSTSYTDITGMSASITPSSTSNKILVLVEINGGALDQAYIKLVRTSTDINVGAAAGSRTLASGGDMYNLGTSGTIRCTHLSFLDSPSTTSSTTYKIQGRIISSTTFAINRSTNDGDSSNLARTASNITLIEIKG